MSDRCHPHQTRSCSRCTPAPVPDLAAIRALADKVRAALRSELGDRPWTEHEREVQASVSLHEVRLLLDWLDVLDTIPAPTEQQFRDHAQSLIDESHSNSFVRNLPPLPAPTEPTGEREALAEMCPNCVTPWKCNGPHEFETSPGGFMEVFDPAAQPAERAEVEAAHDPFARTCVIVGLPASELHDRPCPACEQMSGLVDLDPDFGSKEDGRPPTPHDGTEGGHVKTAYCTMNCIHCNAARGAR